MRLLVHYQGCRVDASFHQVAEQLRICSWRLCMDITSRDRKRVACWSWHVYNMLRSTPFTAAWQCCCGCSSCLLCCSMPDGPLAMLVYWLVG
jgi:hypothetical protein